MIDLSSCTRPIFAWSDRSYACDHDRLAGDSLEYFPLLYHHLLDFKKISRSASAPTNTSSVSSILSRHLQGSIIACMDILCATETAKAVAIYARASSSS